LFLGTKCDVLRLSPAEGENSRSYNGSGFSEASPRMEMQSAFCGPLMLPPGEPKLAPAAENTPLPLSRCLPLKADDGDPKLAPWPFTPSAVLPATPSIPTSSTFRSATLLTLPLEIPPLEPWPEASSTHPTAANGDARPPPTPKDVPPGDFCLFRIDVGGLLRAKSANGVIAPPPAEDSPMSGIPRPAPPSPEREPPARDAGLRRDRVEASEPRVGGRTGSVGGRLDPVYWLRTTVPVPLNVSRLAMAPLNMRMRAFPEGGTVKNGNIHREMTMAHAPGGTKTVRYHTSR